MACYYGTLHLEATQALVDICLEKGQRALVGKCSMDRNSPDTYVEYTSTAISSAQDFVASFPHLHPAVTASTPSLPPLVQPILTPRMAISTTPELLTSLSTLAKSFDPPLAIQTHLSENDEEIRTVGRLFPESKSYTAVYDDFGLLGPGTVLAHCVHLTQEERELIKEKDAGISHCPTSNYFIASGEARVREMLDEGIKVGGLGENHHCTYAVWTDSDRLGLVVTARGDTRTASFPSCDWRRMFHNPTHLPMRKEEHTSHYPCPKRSTWLPWAERLCVD
jgi:guanine deaminase